MSTLDKTSGVYFYVQVANYTQLKLASKAKLDLSILKIDFDFGLMHFCHQVNKSSGRFYSQGP